MSNDRTMTIKVKVEPRSSRSEVIGMHGGSLKVKLTSPPVEGRANKELIEVLAKKYDLKKRDIEIVAGHSSKTKLVRLPSVPELRGLF